MNIPVSVALVGLALTIAGIIYKAGRDRERFANNERQAKQWADGLGGIVRTNSTRQERRWMLQLADDVENAETEGKRKQIAIRIREEIWRS
jgi:hypothetical protein